MYVFCLSCPGATFALQRGGFVPRESLAAKDLLGLISRKQNVLIGKTTRVARASPFFVHFFAVTARLRRENA